MTRAEQLHIGLIVCETVLEALIRTHPNKQALRRELAERFAALRVNAASGDMFGEQEQAHLAASMDALLLQLNETT
jgi:hypothetical protein